MPIIPNYKKGVGRIAADLYDFQAHVDGYSFRHHADQIDLFPTVIIGSERTNVQDAIVALSAAVFSAVVADATSTIKGVLKLSGDLAGSGSSADTPKISGIQGFPVSFIAPINGQILTWNGSVWLPQSPSSSFVVGGDLSGSSSNQQVNALHSATTSINISSAAAPTSGQVLTATSGTAATWQTISVGSGFTAGGDLSGSSSSQNVINIHGASVPIAGGLITGNVLQVSGSSTLSYAAVNLAGGSNYVVGSLPITNQDAQSLSGDATGTTAAVVNVQARGLKSASTTVSVSAATAPSSGQVLTATSSTTATWQTSTIFTAGGDLSGTSSSQTVIKINGTPITAQSLGAGQDGYVLEWSNSDGYAKWNPVTGGSFTAGGDLSGTGSSQTVIKLNGNPISTQTLGSLTDGYVITWSNVDGYYKAKPTNSFTAGGDLTGTSSSQAVVSITGTGGKVSINCAEIDYGTASSGLTTIIPVSGALSTSDATPTTILTYPIPASTLSDFVITILGLRISGAGSPGDCYRADFPVSYQRISTGAPVVVGAAAVETFKKFNGNGVNYIPLATPITISVNNLIVQVTGVAGTVIHWTAIIQGLQVS